MKTNLLKTALLAASFFGVAATASAEIVHANIPFEFSANGKSMPAGMYTIQPLAGSSSILVFKNETTNEKAMAFVRTTPSASSKGVALTIKTAYVTYELSQLPKADLSGALLSVTK
jgi:hypothetical protein